ncbi:hypothetical protein [Ancylobacter sp.]|uniref:hypothetical protein n=1 Tax=Ancylobacter sp. TaxID=1872567 RepID=UPI003C7DD723
MRRSLAFAVTAALWILPVIPAHAAATPLLVVTLTLNGAVVFANPEGSSSPRLTDEELKGFGTKLMGCWRIAASAVKSLNTEPIEIMAMLNADGSRAGPIGDMTPSPKNNPAVDALHDSAIRSVKRCIPVDLPSAKHDRWKVILVRFAPFERQAQSGSTVVEREVYVRSPTWRNVTEAVTLELGERLTGCWRRSAAKAELDKLPRISMQFQLKQDGNVAKEPVFYDDDPTSPSKNAPKGAARDNAIKRAKAAIYRCAPYSFLPKSTFTHWQTIIADF